MKPHPEEALRQAIERGHETRDASVKWVMVAGVGLMVLIVTTLLLMNGVLRHFAGKQARLDPAPSPLAGQRVGASGPKLQPDPYGDLAAFQAQERRILENYYEEKVQGRPTGRVQIPVGRAMDIMLERGLLNRPTTAPAGGLVPATRTRPGE